MIVIVGLASVVGLAWGSWMAGRSAAGRSYPGAGGLFTIYLQTICIKLTVHRPDKRRNARPRKLRI